MFASHLLYVSVFLRQNTALVRVRPFIPDEIKKELITAQRENYSLNKAESPDALNKQGRLMPTELAWKNKHCLDNFKILWREPSDKVFVTPWCGGVHPAKGGEDAVLIRDAYMRYVVSRACGMCAFSTDCVLSLTDCVLLVHFLCSVVHFLCFSVSTVQPVANEQAAAMRQFQAPWMICMVDLEHLINPYMLSDVEQGHFVSSVTAKRALEKMASQMDMPTYATCKQMLSAEWLEREDGEYVASE